MKNLSTRVLNAAASLFVIAAFVLELYPMSAGTAPSDAHRLDSYIRLLMNWRQNTFALPDILVNADFYRLLTAFFTAAAIVCRELLFFRNMGSKWPETAQISFTLLAFLPTVVRIAACAQQGSTVFDFVISPLLLLSCFLQILTYRILIPVSESEQA